jgi:hypothetical protein
MSNRSGSPASNARHGSVRSPADLPAAWRERAAEMRRYGAEPQAVTLDAVAAELEAALRAEADEELTLAEAAAESGYSSERLRRKVADGEIPNAGRKGAPRIRRGDLPRKATTRAATPEAVAARIVAGWGSP